MNTTFFWPLANHLWQSTLFALAVGLLTLTVRNNGARVRHTLWFAASCKFLLPFSLLVALGGQIGHRTVLVTAPSSLAAVMDEVSRPFTAPRPAVHSHGVAPDPQSSPLAPILAGVWMFGVLAIGANWALRYRRVSRSARAALKVAIESPIAVRESAGVMEPGVFGILRPVLLIPRGMVQSLSAAQLRAVLHHELCHVQHKDNAIAALQMLVETVFWFHPLVWWMGRRMVVERERACDEQVLSLGNSPRTYAEAILTVCKLYAVSPVTCVSGVTGGDLSRRIEAVMAKHRVERVTRLKKLMLAAAALATVLGPLTLGMLAPRVVTAQQPANTAPLKFEAASVKVNKSYGDESHMKTSQGQLTFVHVTLKSCIVAAYGMTEDHILGQAWLDTERYDIVAKSVPGSDQEHRLRLQNLLQERFGLAVHKETREGPVFELVAGKSKPKLQPDSPNAGGSGIDSDKDGEVAFTAITMTKLAAWLERPRLRLGRPVIDKTGLTDHYSFTLHWLPEENVGGAGHGEPGSAVVAALQEQLGLKLEGKKGPIDFLIVDHAEKVPTEN